MWLCALHSGLATSLTDVVRPPWAQPTVMVVGADGVALSASLTGADVARFTQLLNAGYPAYYYGVAAAAGGSQSAG